MYESKMKSKETDRLVQAFLTLHSEEEVYRFLDDLCTYSEILSMSQRLSVALMLRKGETNACIAQGVGVAPATVTRVNKCLQYGSGGYELVLERLQKPKEGEKLD